MDRVCKDYQKLKIFEQKSNGNAEENFSGLSSAPHGHIVFTVSLKPSLNLRPFKWVNCSFKRDNNFTPIVS